MQIAHRKTQTDHKMLSDRTDALAARVDAVQADLRGAMCGDEEVEALRTRMQTAEELLAELQGRLSATEAAFAEAKVQAEAQAQAAGQVVETKVSPCTHAHSALCAYSVQSDADVAAPVTVTTAITPITPTRKRKRGEDNDDGDVDADGNDVRKGEEDDSARARCTKTLARKRPRRLARTAAQVTAAAVIGAVAAWSALAFV